MSQPRLNPIKEKVQEIEIEMKRIGYWTSSASVKTDDSKLYAGLSFECWLQFVFLPKVSAASESGVYSEIPKYRVGLASLRHYDYHSIIEEAFPLMELCFQLEELLAPEFHKLQVGGSDSAPKIENS